MHENTVKATNQLKKDQFVRFINPEGKGKRVLFLGNSIMLHGVKEEIGWFNEWGMAASKKENDFLHLLTSKITEKDPDAAYCLAQVSKWEVDYKDPAKILEYYKSAADFGADIIVARMIDNCQRATFEGDKFTKSFNELIKFLNTKDTDKIAVTTGFWPHPGNETLKEISANNGFAFVKIDDLGDDPEMKAIGLFEHNGVQSHPGDKGMKEIADRIWKKINKWF